MPRGLPDAANVVVQHEGHALDDMAELAVRLYSPVVFSRSGKVLYLDDFESGLGAWTLAAPGAVGEILLTSEDVYFGGHACKLLTHDVGASIASISKRFPPVDLQVLGGQMCFAVVTGVKWLDFEIRLEDGVDSYYFNARYEHTTGKLYVQTGMFAYTEFADHGVLTEGLGIYHHVKLYVDTESKAFVRLLFDNVEYNLSGYTPATQPNPISPREDVWIRVTSQDDVSGMVYVDSIVLTTDEV